MSESFGAYYYYYKIFIFVLFLFFIRMMGEAKQIIIFDDEKKLKFDKVELENILNQEQVKGLPMMILSVIGAFRTGKSFLISWLVSYFKAHLKVSNIHFIYFYCNTEHVGYYMKNDLMGPNEFGF